MLIDKSYEFLEKSHKELLSKYEKIKIENHILRETLVKTRESLEKIFYEFDEEIK